MSPRTTPPTPPAPCVLTSRSQLTPTRGGWLVDGVARSSLSGCRVDLRAGEELRLTLHTREERAPEDPVELVELVAPASTEPVTQVLVPPPPPEVLVPPPPPARGLGGAGAVLLAIGLAYLRYGRPRARDRDRDRTEPCTLAPRVEALERRLEALEREARERAPCPARELLERVGV